MTHDGQTVGPAGFEPATKRLCIPLQLSLSLSGLRAGTTPSPGLWAPATRLVHLPQEETEAWLGITMPFSKGFPDFDRFSTEDFYFKVALYKWIRQGDYNPVMMKEF